MLHTIFCNKIVIALGALLMSILNTYSTISSGEELILSTNAFKSGGMIPVKYTCDGKNVSPELSWNKIDDALSYVLIVDDPDAPKKFLKAGEDAFVHWVVYDIEPHISSLPEGVLADALTGYAKQGVNSFGTKNYGGPCPPAGPAHRYRFRLYALNKKLNLKDGATKEEVTKAIKDSVIAQAELTGTFERQG